MSESKRDRAALAHQKMRERESRLRELRGHYAKYGDNVMAIILQYHNEHGDLRRLVHRVTGRVVRAAEHQHEVLLDYLTRHGEAVFLRQLQTSSSRSDAPEKADVSHAEKTPAASARGTGRMVKLPTGEMIEDRRTGEERRKQADRRRGLETIYKNRRYGGDRRRGGDRRKRNR